MDVVYLMNEGSSESVHSIRGLGINVKKSHNGSNCANGIVWDRDIGYKSKKQKI